MKKITLGILFVATSLLATSYKPCIACHGKNGEKEMFAKLKGLSKADVVMKLKGYQNGTYGGKMKGIMKMQVAYFADTDIQKLALIISKFK